MPSNDRPRTSASLGGALAAALAALVAGCGGDSPADDRQRAPTPEKKAADPTSPRGSGPGPTVREFLGAYAKRSSATCDLLAPELRRDATKAACLARRNARRSEALDQPQELVDSEVSGPSARVLSITTGRVPIRFRLERTNGSWKIAEYELRDRLKKGERPRLE